jgi:hypothetical protein
MSSDKHSLPPSPYRCDAISSETPYTAVPHTVRSFLRKPTDPLADDPAMLIGLALGHVRRSDGLTGQVPASILSRLKAHADRGNPACRLLLDWIARRNRDLLASPQAVPARQPQSTPRMARRRVRERRQAVPGTGSLKLRKPEKRKEASDPETAITAATKGGEIDG